MSHKSHNLILSVVIPAYNEEGRVEKTLKHITSYLKKYCGSSYEIIIVNDCSVDKTGEKVLRWKKYHPEIRLKSLSYHQGKGAAVRVGVAAAAGRFILVSDADLATPIEELPRFIAHLEHRADVAIASRYRAGAKIKVAQPGYRRITSQFFRYITQKFILQDTHLVDTQCGFKCFKRDVAKSLFSEAKLQRFAFDVEILYLIQRKGYKSVEIPVRWRHIPGSKFRPFRDFALMLFDLLRIPFLHRKKEHVQ